MTKLPSLSERGRVMYLVLEGTPVGKARPRVTFTRGWQSGTYTPKKTALEEERWRVEFKKSGADPFPDDAPLYLILRAYYPMPKKPRASFPTSKPDPDNVLKLVMDALTGLAYKDDAVFVRIELHKFWASLGTNPRVEIEIEALP